MIYSQNIFHYIIYKENLTAIVLSLKKIIMEMRKTNLTLKFNEDEN